MDAPSTTTQPDGLDWAKVSRHFRSDRYSDFPGSTQATFAASFINVIAWVVVAAVVIVGALLAKYRDPLVSGSRPLLERHPLALYGFALVLVGFIQMMVVNMAANFVKATMAFHSEAGAFLQAVVKAAEPTTSPTTSTIASSSNERSRTPLETVRHLTESSTVPVVAPSSGSDDNLAMTYLGSTPSAQGNAPGWYPDPSGSGLRWWQGTYWSGDTKPSHSD